jgi:hypothetical protein
MNTVGDIINVAGRTFRIDGTFPSELTLTEMRPTPSRTTLRDDAANAASWLRRALETRNWEDVERALGCISYVERR